MNVQNEDSETAPINDYIYNNSIDDETDPIINKRSRSKSFNESFQEALNIKRLSSSISAGWNITNMIQGIGILGVPYACMKGSWIALITNVIAAIVSCSTGKMIINCMYKKLDGNNIRIKIYNDYPDLGEAVWPRYGKSFVAITSVVEMFGASALYLILMGLSLATLFKDIIPQMNQQHWLAISAFLVLCTLSIKQLSLISWFSLVAIFGLFGTIISILIYCLTQYTLFAWVNFPPIKWQNIPVSSGIIVFSYCAHAVLPTIENNMKHPKRFNLVMNSSFFVATITKTIFGFLPLFIFGSQIAQSVSDNVPVTNIGFYLTTKILVLINAFFSMPLVIYVISDRIDQGLLMPYFHPNLWPNGKFHLLWMFFSRSIIVLALLLTALIVPYFALVMSFIGSFTGTNLTFLLPCWFSLVLQGKELSPLQKLYRILIIICGTFVGLTGMFFAAKEIIQISQHKI